jgi:MFS family permease
MMAREAEENGPVYVKITRHLMPWLVAMYMVAFMDRINIGFAKPYLEQELGIGELAYGIGAGLFFAGYVLLEIPSNLLLHKIGARLTMARILVLWGIVSSGMAFITDTTQFYAGRILLGFGEAGFFPGIILYLTYWYPENRRSRMVSYFMMAIPLSGIYGSPLSGAIIHAMEGELGMQGWRWMFLLEGLPAVLLGLLAYRVLDDRPSCSRFLSEDEKDSVTAGLKKQSLLPDRREDIAHAFTNPSIWALSLSNHLMVMSLYSAAFWLPQQCVKVSGNPVTGSMVAALPYAAALLCMVLWGIKTDREDRYKWVMVGIPLAFAGAIGLSGATMGTDLSILAGMTAILAGTLAAMVAFWPLPSALLSGKAEAAGLALVNSIGSLGGLTGPVLTGWIAEQGIAQSNQWLILSMIPLLACLLTAYSMRLSPINRKPRERRRDGGLYERRRAARNSLAGTGCDGIGVQGCPQVLGRPPGPHVDHSHGSRGDCLGIEAGRQDSIPGSPYHGTEVKDRQRHPAHHRGKNNCPKPKAFGTPKGD